MDWPAFVGRPRIFFQKLTLRHPSVWIIPTTRLPRLNPRFIFTVGGGGNMYGGQPGGMNGGGHQPQMKPMKPEQGGGGGGYHPYRRWGRSDDAIIVKTPLLLLMCNSSCFHRSVFISPVISDEVSHVHQGWLMKIPTFLENWSDFWITPGDFVRAA